MTFVMLSCKNPMLGIYVGLSQSGNEYYLTYGDNDGDCVTSGMFSTFDQAFEAFTKIAYIVGRGLHTPSERRDMVRAMA